MRLQPQPRERPQHHGRLPDIEVLEAHAQLPRQVLSHPRAQPPAQGAQGPPQVGKLLGAHLVELERKCGEQLLDEGGGGGEMRKMREGIMTYHGHSEMRTTQDTCARSLNHHHPHLSHVHTCTHCGSGNTLSVTTAHSTLTRPWKEQTSGGHF